MNVKIVHMAIRTGFYKKIVTAKNQNARNDCIYYIMFHEISNKQIY